MLLDGLLHRDLLAVPLLGVQLRLEADELLGHRRALVGLARLLLALFLIVIQSATISAGAGGGRDGVSGGASGGGRFSPAAAGGISRETSRSASDEAHRRDTKDRSGHKMHSPLLEKLDVLVLRHASSLPLSHRRRCVPCLGRSAPATQNKFQLR